MRTIQGVPAMGIAAVLSLSAVLAQAGGPTPPPPPASPAAKKPAEALSLEARLKQVDDILAKLERELSILEKDIHASARPKKVTSAALLRACEESFSISSFLDDLDRNWIAQGGRMRGEVAGEYTDKLIKEAQRTILDNLPAYYQCVSRAMGKPTCTGLQALAPNIVQGKLVSQLQNECQKAYQDYGRNHAFARSLITRSPDAAALCKAWWLDRPENSGVSLKRESIDQACGILIKNPGDAAGTCAQLAPFLRQPSAEMMQERCQYGTRQAAEFKGHLGRNPERRRLCREWWHQRPAGEFSLKPEAVDQGCQLIAQYGLNFGSLCAKLQPLMTRPVPGKPCEDKMREQWDYLWSHGVRLPESPKVCRDWFAAKLKSGEFEASNEVVEQACRIMLSVQGGDPAAVCPQLVPIFQQSYRDSSVRHCQETLRYLDGDGAVCSSIREAEVNKNCKAYAAFRKARKAGDPESCGAPGTTAADICRQMMTSGPQSCDRPIANIKKWYCSRFQRPEFAKAAADRRREIDMKYLALYADREKEVRARFGVISGMLYEATNRLDGIQPHETDDWQERHARINELYARKDRLFKQIGKPASSKEESGED